MCVCVCVCVSIWHEYVYMYIYTQMDLLEWFTVIGPACPTMTVSQWTGHDSPDSLVQETGCVSWSSVCVIALRNWALVQGRNASAEGRLTWPVKVRASRQEVKAFFFHVLLWAATRRCGPDLR